VIAPPPPPAEGFAHMSQKAKQLVQEEAEAHAEVRLEPGDSVIIVSNILPVSIRRVIVNGRSDFEVTWNHDNLLSKKGSFGGAMRVLWVGGVIIDAEVGAGLFDGNDEITDVSGVDEMEEPLLEHRLLAFNCVPVFLKPEVLRAHHHYCKKTLYPVLHSIVDVYGDVPTQHWDPEVQQSSWEMYIRVNRLFAQKAFQSYQPGDSIWVSRRNAYLKSVAQAC
jgi:trehalose-6-phosphate synthase